MLARMLDKNQIQVDLVYDKNKLAAFEIWSSNKWTKTNLSTNLAT